MGSGHSTRVFALAALWDAALARPDACESDSIRVKAGLLPDSSL